MGCKCRRSFFSFSFSCKSFLSQTQKSRKTFGVFGSLSSLLLLALPPHPHHPPPFRLSVDVSIATCKLYMQMASAQRAFVMFKMMIAQNDKKRQINKLYINIKIKNSFWGVGMVFVLLFLFRVKKKLKIFRNVVVGVCLNHVHSPM